jgi:hypothetical protein
MHAPRELKGRYEKLLSKIAQGYEGDVRKSDVYIIY